jgi:hypothetical protein
MGVWDVGGVDSNSGVYRTASLDPDFDLDRFIKNPPMAHYELSIKSGEVHTTSSGTCARSGASCSSRTKTSKPNRTGDPVAPAKRSEAALQKVLTHTLPDGTPAHSLRTLLKDLGTIVRNTCVTRSAGRPGLLRHLD